MTAQLYNKQKQLPDFLPLSPKGVPEGGGILNTMELPLIEVIAEIELN